MTPSGSLVPVHAFLSPHPALGRKSAMACTRAMRREAAYFDISWGPGGAKPGVPSRGLLDSCTPRHGQPEHVLNGCLAWFLWIQLLI